MRIIEPINAMMLAEGTEILFAPNVHSKERSSAIKTLKRALKKNPPKTSQVHWDSSSVPDSVRSRIKE